MIFFSVNIKENSSEIEKKKNDHKLRKYSINIALFKLLLFCFIHIVNFYFNSMEFENWKKISKFYYRD